MLCHFWDKKRPHCCGISHKSTVLQSSHKTSSRPCPHHDHSSHSAPRQPGYHQRVFVSVKHLLPGFLLGTLWFQPGLGNRESNAGATNYRERTAIISPSWPSEGWRTWVCCILSLSNKPNRREDVFYYVLFSSGIQKYPHQRPSRNLYNEMCSHTSCLVPRSLDL